MINGKYGRPVKSNDIEINLPSKINCRFGPQNFLVKYLLLKKFYTKDNL